MPASNPACKSTSFLPYAGRGQRWLLLDDYAGYNHFSGGGWFCTSLLRCEVSHWVCAGHIWARSFVFSRLKTAALFFDDFFLCSSYSKAAFVRRRPLKYFTGIYLIFQETNVLRNILISEKYISQKHSKV